MNNGLRTAREIAVIISLLGVPALVAYMQYVSAQESVREQYVSMAVGLLQKPAATEKDDDADKELRTWAVDIVNQSAPVKLSESLKSRLAGGNLNLTWSDGGFMNPLQMVPRQRPDGLQPIPRSWGEPERPGPWLYSYPNSPAAPDKK
jgi:hypothetical protein